MAESLKMEAEKCVAQNQSQAAVDIIDQTGITPSEVALVFLSRLEIQ